MKIAVLGANGQLGRDLCPRLKGEVVALTRSQIDLNRPETIALHLETVRPDILINCAAYNFVDRAESEPEAAFRSNAWGVRELAKVCHDLDCRLVHLSTDYVFGLEGDRQTPLFEDDPPGPVSVYGLSKLTGEYLVRSISPRNLVVRTCGLYGVWGSGGKGGNFVETMLRLASQSKPLRVVNDQRCTPTYTADLADSLVDLIERQAQGLFHVTSSGDCSWYELASEVFRQARVNADLTPTTSEQFAAPARRPTYSVLATEKLVAAGVPRLRHWTEALAAYFLERETRHTSAS